MIESIRLQSEKIRFIYISMINYLQNKFYSWEFRIDDHDIKFGLLRKANDGSQTEVIPIRKVTAQRTDEVGIITCEIPATCK